MAGSGPAAFNEIKKGDNGGHLDCSRGSSQTTLKFKLKKLVKAVLLPKKNVYRSSLCGDELCGAVKRQRHGLES